jgi:hypothetical protein
MKYIKNFESKKHEEQIEILRDLIDENPLSVDHDFYIFLASDTFKEDKNGLYKKVLDIENMVLIKPDINSLGAMAGLKMRAMVQHGTKLYHIWLPKDFRNDVEGRSSNRMDKWVLDLIDKYKVVGTDEHGKMVYKNVLDRRADMDKYNL